MDGAEAAYRAPPRPRDAVSSAECQWRPLASRHSGAAPSHSASQQAMAPLKMGSPLLVTALAMLGCVRDVSATGAPSVGTPR